MTGYGAARYDENGLKIRVEVKSLNSKFLDSLVKMPKELSDKELEVKSLVGDVLQRGKISMTVEYEAESSASSAQVNEQVFKAYYEKLKSLAVETDSPHNRLFESILQLPDIMTPAENAISEREWLLILEQIKGSLRACDEHRLKEGEKLNKELVNNIKVIGEKLTAVAREDPNRIKGIKGRIAGNLKEHLGSESYDENRFEQELVYFLEKLDITEEKVRLKSHLDYFLEVIGANTSQGKKLGFIAQEIGREINTIGSKANNVTIQHLVVEMKEELEKIREQLLNIL